MTRIRPGLALVGGLLLVLLVAAALLAPMLAPYDPADPMGEPLDPPSAAHLLGTDDLGRDMFSRLLWGTRSSLSTASLAGVLALGLGIFFGAGAPLLGGLADLATARVVDVLLAVPRLPLLVLAVALAGGSGSALAVLTGLLLWAPVARILRAETLSLRMRGYVAAARGFGAGTGHLLLRHLLPALGPLVIAQAVAVAGSALLLESALAFLGLGDPARVSWALEINRALTQPGIMLTSAWQWWVLPAGAAITVAVLAFTFLGIGLEPMLDPRRGRRP